MGFVADQGAVDVEGDDFVGGEWGWWVDCWGGHWDFVVGHGGWMLMVMLAVC